MLGTLEVEADGRDLTPARPKQRALLALLLLNAGAVVPIDDLVDALWGPRPPETARTALHGHVSALRKRLGAGRIETRAPGYLFRLADGDQLDLHQLEELVAKARSAADASLRVDVFGEALELIRGEPLVDFRYEPFARQEALRLEELRLSVLEERLAAELELGRHTGAIPQLERLVVEHPLRERLRAQLMLALYRAGRQADALRVFEDARRVLISELGIEPGLSLQQLERRILNHDASLAGVAEKPSGVVTFLAADRPPDEALVHGAIARHGGLELEPSREVPLLVAFARAGDAAAAAVELQRSAATDGLRIGVASAEAGFTTTGYAGLRVRDAETVRAAAHRGQTLVSQSTRDLLRELPSEEIDVRDVGKHVLTDLAPARRLFQLVIPGLRSEFPPPRSLAGSATNLPHQPAPLVGRKRELEDLAGLLRRDEVRLVTLTGAGGTGKTRLAAQVGALLLDEFPDGVIFVDLAPLMNPALVLEEAAHTLGVPRTAAECPVGEDVIRHLRRGRYLLVLDNFEHLLDAAPAVLEVAAAAKLLVTSRAPLRVTGELVYPVSPLETAVGDDVEALASVDSVALFVARAQAVRPEFALSAGNAADVAGICTALDGLPLAIELAAPRVTVLPPASLRSRLDARLKLLTHGPRRLPERHRALRTTIEWSYDLLEPEEQRLFERLAVFVGGCSLEAVECICGDDVEHVAALSSLVDASLVRSEGSDDAPRFPMLETIREYAAERLEQSGDAEAIRRRHAQHFLALAEDVEPQLRGSPGVWLESLEWDNDNLRAALDRLDAAGEDELTLRFAGSLWRYWYLTGRCAEGSERLERALAADDRPTAARGKALIGAAVMAANRGDTGLARRRAEEAIDLHRALGDAWGETYSLFMLGAAVGDDGELERAVELDEESARRFRELGDEHSALLATRNLARMFAALGDRGRARELHEHNLRSARLTDNQRIAASALSALAMIAVADGRVEDAYPMLTESLSIHRDLGDFLDSAVDLCRFAFVLAFDGHVEKAVRLLASFDAHADEVGGRRAWVAEINDDTLTTVRTRLDDDAFASAWQEGAGLTIGEAVTLALDGADGAL